MYNASISTAEINMYEVYYQQTKIILQQAKIINELNKVLQAQQSKNNFIEIITTGSTIIGAICALYKILNKDD